MKTTGYPSQRQKRAAQRRKPRQQRKPSVRPRSKKSVSSGVRVTKLLPELDEVSAPVEDTCTPEHMMVFFSGFFARFHERGTGYIPYELQTVDCPLAEADGMPVLDETGKPFLMRCVREIVRSQRGKEESWLLITWEVGIPGVTMTPCSSLAHAKELLHAPPPPIVWSGWDRWRQRCTRQAEGRLASSSVRAEHT